MNHNGNLENRFTGWVDVPLSPRGEQEAREAGEKLLAYRFDYAFTSVLTRAIRTLEIVMDVIGQPGLPVERNQALKRTHVRRPARPQQNRDRGKIRRSPSQNCGEEVTTCGPRAEKVCRTPPNAYCPITGSGSGRASPTARRSWSRRTGTACEPSSCTSTVLSREDVLELNIPTGAPLLYELDDHGQALTHRYFVTLPPQSVIPGIFNRESRLNTCSHHTESWSLKAENYKRRRLTGSDAANFAALRTPRFQIIVRFDACRLNQRPSFHDSSP